MENRGIVQLNRHMAEACTALAILAAVIILFIHSLSLPPSPMRGYPGPAFIPQIILAYTGLFTVFWLIGLAWSRLRPAADKIDPILDSNRFEFEYSGYFITLATVLAFVVGLDHLGFEITCFAITFLLLYPRVRSLATALLAAMATTLTIYVVFALMLSVSIPLAFLPSYIAF